MEFLHFDTGVIVLVEYFAEWLKGWGSLSVINM
jgi:hypothetical protein